jgi:hypothetical protein
MAMPPRRWVAYALLTAGLSFLFDTLTFLRTNWSPLHIPMYAENELAIGYLLTVAGVLLMLAPSLSRMLGRYAPDAPTKASTVVADQSVDNRIQERLTPSSKALFLRKTVSWITIAFGLLFGFWGLSMSGSAWLPNRATNPYWYKPLIGIAGFLFLGLTLVAGSCIASRDRRRAGLIFLIGTPIIAFCMSFPDVGFLVWEKTGDGVFYSPFLWIALGLSVLFFVPFFVSLGALPNKKRALYLFLISAAVVSPVFVRSQWTASLLPRLAGWSAATLVLGLFWLQTEVLGWSPLVEPRKRSAIRRVLAVVLVCFVIVGLDIVTTLAFTAWQSSTNGPDCGGRGLFTEPVFPDHAVFTARLIRTGHSTHAIVDSRKWAGAWAVGIVHQRFWGLPSAWPRFVLLTNGIFWEGETYLIDGRREHGFLTRFLPVITAGPCSRTRSIVDATVDLRILGEKSVPAGARIVGVVQQSEPFRQWPSPPVSHTPLAGARIDLSGSSGTTVVTTDQDGVYEIDGLQPDNYTLKVELPDTQITREEHGPERQREIRKEEFSRQPVIERDFHVAWNGTIEGTVRDLAGHPAHPQLQLQNPDGTDLGPGMNYTGGTRDDGSYRFEQVPAGRYVIMVNPDGPGEGWPYESQYYPSAVHIGGAHVFEIAEGQHIKNVDLVVKRVAEREVHARVTWPNGDVPDVASIYVAYEHTQKYEHPRGIFFVALTTMEKRSSVCSALHAFVCMRKAG